MSRKVVALDANILIRAVLGQRVRRILAELGAIAGLELYGSFESEARKRLGARDPDDLPVLATALARK